jgi:type III secretion protein I
MQMEIVTTGMALQSIGDGASKAAGAAMPDARAVARFEEIMQAAPAAVAGPDAMAHAAPAVAVAAPGSAPGGPQSIGERILTGLNGLSGDLQHAWNGVSTALDAGSTMTTAELLKMQMSLTQISIRYELVNKAVTRSTQNVDQLVKIQ